MVKHDAKFAEKLSILNHHGVGICTRLYNVKKTFESAHARPAILSDKALDPLLKGALKKFPQLDVVKLNGTPVQARRSEIVKALEPHYFTFVDALEFRDVAIDLLSSLAAAVDTFDVTENFEMTKALLQLVSSYISALILISRIEDRKLIACTFATVHQFQYSNNEPNFPRLAQWMNDYDVPLRKLQDDFFPLSKAISGAVLSMKTVYARLHGSADSLRKNNILALLTAPNQLSAPTVSEDVLADTLSMDEITKWILFVYSVSPGELQNPDAHELLRQALVEGFVTPVFRDESMCAHVEIDNAIINYKGPAKLDKIKKALGDFAVAAVQSSGSFHAERREYVRQALYQLSRLFADKPGIRGPKMLTAVIVLNMARDEVVWYIRHFEQQPPKTKAKMREEDFQDATIGEIIHLILELAGIVRQHSKVIQRYYVQFLSGYDLQQVKAQDVISRAAVPDEESLLLNAVTEYLASLSVRQVDEGPRFNLDGLRLDWFRLQSLMSGTKAPLSMSQNLTLVKRLNAAMFHSKCVDSVEQLVRDSCGLGDMWFFRKVVADHFEKSLAHPGQALYSGAFPRMCVDFLQVVHDFLPEEKAVVGSGAAKLAQTFLEKIAAMAANALGFFCNEHARLNAQLASSNGVTPLLEKREKPTAAKKGGAPKKHIPPGAESHPRNSAMIQGLPEKTHVLCVDT
eukprot:Opistho-2@35033